MLSSDSQRMDSARPVVLVVHRWDHYLRGACERGGGRRSRPAVMNDSSNPREQTVQVNLFEREAVSFVLYKRRVEPPLGYDRASSCSPSGLEPSRAPVPAMLDHGILARDHDIHRAGVGYRLGWFGTTWPQLAFRSGPTHALDDRDHDQSYRDCAVIDPGCILAAMA
jgi:hypothetical protein